MTDYKCYDLSWPETRLCSYGLCLADSDCVRAAKLHILRILINVTGPSFKKQERNESVPRPRIGSIRN